MFLRTTILATIATLTSISTTYAQTLQGCYKNDGSLTSLGEYQYQSEGYCSTQCKAQGSAVFAMSDGDVCSCGNALPSGGMVDSSLCNVPCVGYPSDTCGGSDYYSVWLTGLGTVADASEASSSSSSSSSSAAAVARVSSTTDRTMTSAPTTTAAPASVIYIITSVVQQGVTVVQTVSASTSPVRSASTASSSADSIKQGSSGGGGGLSGGAIAGIVVGVLAAFAFGLLGIFLYRRRNRDSEEFAGEYKRHIEPAGAGVARPHEPSLDNRLDTSLAIRRNSSESLADNQDYSRKILRVMN